MWSSVDFGGVAVATGCAHSAGAMEVWLADIA
jgi:hypothetical protein